MVLNELITFYFNGGDRDFIFVDGHGVKWAKEEE